MEEGQPFLNDAITAFREGEDQPFQLEEPTAVQVPPNHTEIARRLYVSHFLSTWNSRVFEFGATLYLASIFPQTLLPLSMYALMRGLAAFILSPSVGQYIDKANRLSCVRVSIGTLLCLPPNIIIAAADV